MTTTETILDRLTCKKCGEKTNPAYAKSRDLVCWSCGHPMANPPEAPYALYLDVVYYRDGIYWVGHCTQLDLVSAHRELDEARKGAVRIIRAQIAYGREHDLQVFRPASAGVMRRLALSAREAEGVSQIGTEGGVSITIFHHVYHEE